MALDKTNFDPTASGSKGTSPKIASYTTADTFTVVEADGYFDALDDMLKNADLLVVHSSAAADGGVRVYHVTKTAGDIALTRRIDGGKVYLPFFINQTDLLAGTAQDLVSPVAGRISLLRTTVQVAVTTGDAITVEVNTTAVDGLSITVADAATKGTRQSDAPTAAHASAVVAAGDRIEIIPGAAFATAGAVNGVLEIEVGT